MKRRWMLVLLLLSLFLLACQGEPEEEFAGTIVEINGQTAIVSIEEGEEIRRSGDLVAVDLSKSADGEFQMGDRIRVFYVGGVREKYPLGINTVRVERLERKDGKQVYDSVSAYMQRESRGAFAPHYELLEFQLSAYREEYVEGGIEAVFLYTIIHKNFDKDPDTVAYIREAKEKGSDEYQLLYDEYLMPREMNFHLKAIVDHDGTITLYSNVSPKGVVWEETKMTDYILKNNGEEQMKGVKQHEKTD